MGGPMVKIRYADLPGGLHARAETRGRHAIIYLRPGLTPAQRREGLRRARQSARMGYGPRLPAADVEVALAVDRIRITVRNATAAVCQHPASSALLAGLFSAAVACRAPHPDFSESSRERNARLARPQRYVPAAGEGGIGGALVPITRG
jgi:hypothetical protein